MPEGMARAEDIVQSWKLLSFTDSPQTTDFSLFFKGFLQFSATSLPGSALDLLLRRLRRRSEYAATHAAKRLKSGASRPMGQEAVKLLARLQSLSRREGDLKYRGVAGRC